VNDDAIYDLVRESFKELANEARPADLMPATVRRMRRRTLSISIAAVSLVVALLIGIPVAVAAAGGSRGPGSLPGLTVTQSASAPTRHSGEPALPQTARSTSTPVDPPLTVPSVTVPSLTEPAALGPAARRS
jgi:hypothetical protein